MNQPQMQQHQQGSTTTREVSLADVAGEVRQALGINPPQQQGQPQQQPQQQPQPNIDPNQFQPGQPTDGIPPELKEFIQNGKLTGAYQNEGKPAYKNTVDEFTPLAIDEIKPVVQDFMGQQFKTNQDLNFNLPEGEELTPQSIQNWVLNSVIPLVTHAQSAINSTELSKYDKYNSGTQIPHNMKLQSYSDKVLKGVDSNIKDVFKDKIPELYKFGADPSHVRQLLSEMYNLNLEDVGGTGQQQGGQLLGRLLG